MNVEYRVLGPFGAFVDGRELELGGPKPRATLALLVLQPNGYVPAARLIDGLWDDAPPASASNLVQGYVSGLRKALGKTAIETRGAAYVLHVAPGALDLHAFEVLAEEGSRDLHAGRFGEASETLRRGLALWRGTPFSDLADEPALDVAVARLEELRILALERRIEADLALGRHTDVVPELEFLVAQHPLRERPRGLLMTALYRSGRQADALDVCRAARVALVDELGIEPSAALTELHASILRQEPSLAAPQGAGSAAASGPVRRAILAAILDLTMTETLVSIAGPLARDPERELVLVTTVSLPGELTDASSRLHARRRRLEADGMVTRAAAFTSLAPGIDIANMAREHDVDLLLVDAPGRLLEDARVLALLDRAPCDVGVVVGGESRDGPVLVPFTGAEHDWSAVELGAWLARSRSVALHLVGTTGSGRRAPRTGARRSHRGARGAPRARPWAPPGDPLAARARSRCYRPDPAHPVAREPAQGREARRASGSGGRCRVLRRRRSADERHQVRARTQARVRIVRETSCLTIEVVDDGVGGATTGSGSGLGGLRDRVEALDGTLVIDSPPGAGTTVRAEIPLVPDTGPALGRS